jgi:PBP1b-binding outer membrane lipoprotein LpoB
MHAVLGKGRLISIAALAILASGCASMDDVKHAQATADQALAAAQAAQRESDQNRTDINTLSQRVDEMQRAPRRHGGERG